MRGANERERVGVFANEKCKKAEKMEGCGDRDSTFKKQMTTDPMSYAQ